MLLKVLLRNIVVIACCAVLCGGLAGAYTYRVAQTAAPLLRTVANEITTADARNLELENTLKLYQQWLVSAREYNSQSLLMKVDPHARPNNVALVDISKAVNDAEVEGITMTGSVPFTQVLIDMALSKENVMQSIKDVIGDEDLKDEYIRECISGVDATGGFGKMIVTMEDESKGTEILNIITTNTTNVNVVSFSRQIIVDQPLLEYQNYRLNVINSFNDAVTKYSNLLASSVESVETNTGITNLLTNRLPIYILFGFVFGAVASYMVILLLTILRNRVRTASELYERCEIELLGVMENGSRRPFKGTIQRLSFGKAFTGTYERNLNSLAANIKLVSGGSQIALVSSIDKLNLDDVAEKLKQYGIETVVAGDVLADPRAVDVISTVKSVVIVESIDKTTYANIKEEQYRIKNGACSLLGVVFC